MTNQILYTDLELASAANAARSVADPQDGISYAYLRSFLASLPELSDSYPIMPTEYVKKNDQIRITTATGNIYEVVVTDTDEACIAWAESKTSKLSIKKIQLIDRPEAHPDPVMHPYVLDGGGDLWAWSDIRKRYVEPITGVLCLAADLNGEWTPAKVIADV